MRIFSLLTQTLKELFFVGHQREEQTQFCQEHSLKITLKLLKTLRRKRIKIMELGRVVDSSDGDFYTYMSFITNWLPAVPSILQNILKLISGLPVGGRGSDYASFVMLVYPAFSLSSLSWDYGISTWYTNSRIRTIKIVFDDKEAMQFLTAILAYKAEG